jgi:hypothetical protein
MRVKGQLSNRRKVEIFHDHQNMLLRQEVLMLRQQLALEEENQAFWKALKKRMEKARP